MYPNTVLVLVIILLLKQLCWGTTLLHMEVKEQPISSKACKITLVWSKLFILGKFISTKICRLLFFFLLHTMGDAIFVL